MQGLVPTLSWSGTTTHHLRIQRGAPASATLFAPSTLCPTLAPTTLAPQRHNNIPPPHEATASKNSTTRVKKHFLFLFTPYQRLSAFCVVPGLVSRPMILCCTTNTRNSLRVTQLQGTTSYRYYIASPFAGLGDRFSFHSRSGALARVLQNIYAAGAIVHFPPTSCNERNPQSVQKTPSAWSG